MRCWYLPELPDLPVPTYFHTENSDCSRNFEVLISCLISRKGQRPLVDRVWHVSQQLNQLVFAQVTAAYIKLTQVSPCLHGCWLIGCPNGQSPWCVLAALSFNFQCLMSRKCDSRHSDRQVLLLNEWSHF